MPGPRKQRIEQLDDATREALLRYAARPSGPACPSSWVEYQYAALADMVAPQAGGKLGEPLRRS